MTPQFYSVLNQTMGRSQETPAMRRIHEFSRDNAKIAASDELTKFGMSLDEELEGNKGRYQTMPFDQAIASFDSLYRARMGELGPLARQQAWEQKTPARNAFINEWLATKRLNAPMGEQAAPPPPTAPVDTAAAPAREPNPLGRTWAPPPGPENNMPPNLFDPMGSHTGDFPLLGKEYYGQLLETEFANAPRAPHEPKRMPPPPNMPPYPPADVPTWPEPPINNNQPAWMQPQDWTGMRDQTRRAVMDEARRSPPHMGQLQNENDVLAARQADFERKVTEHMFRTGDPEQVARVKVAAREKNEGPNWRHQIFNSMIGMFPPAPGYENLPIEQDSKGVKFPVGDIPIPPRSADDRWWYKRNGEMTEHGKWIMDATKAIADNEKYAEPTSDGGMLNRERARLQGIEKSVAKTMQSPRIELGIPAFSDEQAHQILNATRGEIAGPPEQAAGEGGEPDMRASVQQQAQMQGGGGQPQAAGGADDEFLRNVNYADIMSGDPKKYEAAMKRIFAEQETGGVKSAFELKDGNVAVVGEDGQVKIVRNPYATADKEQKKVQSVQFHNGKKHITFTDGTEKISDAGGENETGIKEWRVEGDQIIALEHGSNDFRFIPIGSDKKEIGVKSIQTVPGAPGKFVLFYDDATMEVRDSEVRPEPKVGGWQNVGGGWFARDRGDGSTPEYWQIPGWNEGVQVSELKSGQIMSVDGNGNISYEWPPGAQKRVLDEQKAKYAKNTAEKNKQNRQYLADFHSLTKGDQKAFDNLSKQSEFLDIARNYLTGSNPADAAQNKLVLRALPGMMVNATQQGGWFSKPLYEDFKQSSEWAGARFYNRGYEWFSGAMPPEDVQRYVAAIAALSAAQYNSLALTRPYGTDAFAKTYAKNERDVGWKLHQMFSEKNRKLFSGKGLGMTEDEAEEIVFPDDEQTETASKERASRISTMSRADYIASQVGKIQADRKAAGMPALPPAQVDILGKYAGQEWDEQQGFGDTDAFLNAGVEG